MAFTMNNVVTSASMVSAATTATIVSPAAAYFPTGNYQGMAIGGYANITNNTSTTMVLTVRAGATTAGAAVGSPMTVTTVNTNTVHLPFYVVDTTNPPSSQYNLSVNCVSGTGTATTNSACIFTDPVIV